jgi:hypothetical protein
VRQTGFPPAPACISQASGRLRSEMLPARQFTDTLSQSQARHSFLQNCRPATAPFNVVQRLTAGLPALNKKLGAQHKGQRPEVEHSKSSLRKKQIVSPFPEISRHNDEDEEVLDAILGIEVQDPSQRESELLFIILFFGKHMTLVCNLHWLFDLDTFK